MACMCQADVEKPVGPFEVKFSAALPLEPIVTQLFTVCTFTFYNLSSRSTIFQLLTFYFHCFQFIQLRFNFLLSALSLFSIPELHIEINRTPVFTISLF